MVDKFDGTRENNAIRSLILVAMAFRIHIDSCTSFHLKEIMSHVSGLFLFIRKFKGEWERPKSEDLIYMRNFCLKYKKI